MAHTYNISEFGLKLIKAYEGFRPAETKLVSGQKVIGYGHLYVPGEMVMLTKKRAEALLLTDLEPYETLVNNNVYAPLSQSQFDALVSLSFNIGEDAFLNSSVLYHLNTGQPLAAAAGFDEWRKSVIGGKTYIVDALVRRRTAEKALFLRPPTGIVATPRHELPPARVLNVQLGDGADDGTIEVFEKSDANGFVEQAPYGASDSQASILTLNETVADDAALEEDVNLENVYIQAETVTDESVPEEVVPEGAVFEETVSESPLILDDTVPLTQDIVDENIVVETVDTDTDIRETEIRDVTIDEDPSPIAVAAAQVSERLDRLIDDEQGEDIEQPTDEEYGLQASAPPDIEQEEPDHIESEQAQVSNEGTGQIFPTMTLVEMDIPGSIEYNLQAPAPEENENIEVENIEHEHVEPALTLVDADNGLLVEQPIDNIDDDEPSLVTELSGPADNDEPETTPEFSHPALNAHIGAPVMFPEMLPEMLDEQTVPEADIQSTMDVQNTIDAHGTTAPQGNTPIATLRNPSPSLFEEDNSKGIGGYLVAPVIGLFLLGAGVWKTKFAPAANANDWIAFIAPITLLIGGLILIGGLYYLLKSRISNRTVN